MNTRLPRKLPPSQILFIGIFDTILQKNYHSPYKVLLNRNLESYSLSIFLLLQDSSNITRLLAKNIRRESPAIMPYVPPFSSIFELVRSSVAVAHANTPPQVGM